MDRRDNMNVYEKLMNIQAELKAPKNQYNDFGKYHYRSCEDILEGLKPVLAKHKTAVTISDEIVLIGDRYYVKATATLIDIEKGDKVEVSAYAREDETKKGMDLSQLTGSTSSYARKYALNGLFAIDDTKDSDATNEHDTEQVSRPKVDKGKQPIIDNSLASDKQLNYIYKLAKQKNYSPESMAGYIKEAYGKDSSKVLTKKEASELIEMLNEMAKEG
ncbi:ERF family protein [Schnuerera sp.]|uniref:ERF family protein n=1 Tax=Schnuerera sp. TaxID=2794844 RepID=UPI002C8FA146|nr:ERF family protein [Schnuerera sp.]HSH36024.1 ERF family protein [Schnuerera sp.]